MDSLGIWSDCSRSEFWASLALKYCKAIHPRLLHHLLMHFGSANEVYFRIQDASIFEIATWQFGLFERWFPEKVKVSLASESWRKAALLEWNSAKIFPGSIILWTDYRYPLGLKQIPDAPPYLYTLGNTELLSHPTIAIVGARKCHSSSLEKAREIAHELASAEICVVSGLARGVDSVAHEGALQCKGGTIAVLGSGLDIVYPPENIDLHKKIQQNGLLVSEFPLGTPPKAENFPIRNRIITGISEGVLIVEAALRSGSLLTARLALEHNRNVYALKPTSDEYSQGCQQLLDDGALQVESASDIIRDIMPQLHAEYFEKKGMLEEPSPTNFSNISINEKKCNLKQTWSAQKKKRVPAKENPSFFSGQTIVEFPKAKQARIGDELEPLPFDFTKIGKNIVGDLEYPILLPKKKKKLKNASSKLTQDLGEETSQKIVKSDSVASVLFTDSTGSTGSANFVASSASTASIVSAKDFANTPKQKNITKAKKESDISPHTDTVDWKALPEIQRSILYLLRNKGVLSIDEMMANLTEVLEDTSKLSTSLLMLEISGHVVRLPGTRYDLASSVGR